MADSASSSSELGTSLKYTPTWVVATVCIIIVAISLFVERFLHYLGKFLKRKRNDALFEAVQKLKEELMLLGFISLLLTVCQNPVTRICITPSTASHMLPCKLGERLTPNQEAHLVNNVSLGLTHNRRRLLSEDAGSDHCTKKGKVPLLSVEALHQLHIFIFVLAAVHVVFCASTMVLGGAKIRQWKHWEKAIREESTENEQSNLDHAPSQPDYKRNHEEFLMRRVKGLWKKSAFACWIGSWVMSFVKQFYGSVTKSDYRALRCGFIMKHCSANKNFNFYKYMMVALEDDFKMVVGISWYLWLFVIVFLVLNVHGWHTYFWLSFLPLILLLLVGAKLEHIITRLAHESAKSEADEQETHRVKPTDVHFWFNRPRTVLYLSHFILFQNSFELAFFIWIWSTYGFKSCIMGDVSYIIPRLVICLVVQVLCSYSTLPLYAIVSQMGDAFKYTIFAEQLRSTLHEWAEQTRKRKRSGSSASSILRTLKFFGPKTSVQMQAESAEPSCKEVAATISMVQKIKGEDV